MMIDYAAICERVDRLDFDTVFTIGADGIVREVREHYAPDVFHDPAADVDIMGDGWFTVSDGMTNQYGYRGPVLHQSETFSPGMIERIMFVHDAGTLFAFTAVNVHDDDCESDCDPGVGCECFAGWIVVGKYAGA